MIGALILVNGSMKNINIMENNRQNAMKWWNSLSYEDKFFKIIEYKEEIKGYPHRGPDSLTGSEIELLYNKEINNDMENRS